MNEIIAGYKTLLEEKIKNVGYDLPEIWPENVNQYIYLTKRGSVIISEKTYLSIAAEFGLVDFCKSLLEVGADANVTVKGLYQSHTPLQISILGTDYHKNIDSALQIIKLLAPMTHLEFNGNQGERDNFSAVYIAEYQVNNGEIGAELLRHGTLPYRIGTTEIKELEKKHLSSGIYLYLQTKAFKHLLSQEAQKFKENPAQYKMPESLHDDVKKILKFVSFKIANEKIILLLDGELELSDKKLASKTVKSHFITKELDGKTYHELPGYFDEINQQQSLTPVDDFSKELEDKSSSLAFEYKAEANSTIFKQGHEVVLQDSKIETQGLTPPTIIPGNDSTSQNLLLENPVTSEEADTNVNGAIWSWCEIL